MQNPEAALTQLCAAIHIPFDPAMLSWAVGPREEDGVWAPWWYESVWASTTFGSPPGELPEIDSAYQNLISACMPHYETLSLSEV